MMDKTEVFLIIFLKFILMKKILNISEMKQVRGGASPSSLCGEGEKMYTCTTDYGNGATSTGKVCASNAFFAEAAIISHRFSESELTGMDVNCV